MRTLILSLILPFALLACASVPLSTMMRMRSFDEKAFAGINPRQVRAKVSFPPGFAVSGEKTSLKVAVESGGKSTHGSFRLNVESSAQETRTAGFFSRPVPVTTATLRLTDDSVDQFRKLQSFVAASTVGSVKLDIEIGLASIPEGARNGEVPAWVELKVSDEDGYFPLIEGQAFPLGKTETHRVGR